MADGLEAAIFPNVKRRHFSAVTVDRVEKTAGPLYGEERWIQTCFLDRDQLPLTGLIYTEYRNSLSARVALTRRAASDISEIASHYSCPVGEPDLRPTYVRAIWMPIQGNSFSIRGGSVCLNSLGRFAKWISASIMLPPSSASTC